MKSRSWLYNPFSHTVTHDMFQLLWPEVRTISPRFQSQGHLSEALIGHTCQFSSHLRHHRQESHCCPQTVKPMFELPENLWVNQIVKENKLTLSLAPVTNVCRCLFGLHVSLITKGEPWDLVFALWGLNACGYNSLFNWEMMHKYFIIQHW